MKKRMSKLFLTVAMVITLMSVMSVTAAAETYDLWVCGVQVTSENCDKITELIPAEKGTVTGEITYDPVSRILTLKNADIDVAGEDIQGIKVGIMALTLNLVGNNEVTNNSNSNAIFVDRFSSLTINGSGSLTASAGSSNCIRGFGPLEIQSGTVTATATGNDAAGIYAKYGVTISGGKVTAKGVDENGNIVSNGIDAASSNINISDGEVEAIGRHGIYTASGKVNISGGKVTATGNGGDYYGIHCNSIEISQGDPSVETLVIVTNNSSGTGLYSRIGSITISGGTVIARGDDGIYASNGSNVTISGGTVTATGSNRGIYTFNGNITISGGTVTAKGSSSFGIYSGTSNVKISGGTVTASGSPAINCDPNGIPATHQIFVGSDMSGVGAAALDNSTRLNTYQYINIAEPHSHNWSYTGNENTITATCNGADICSATENTVTITLEAPDMVYDGTAKTATAISSDPDELPAPEIITYSGPVTDGQAINVGTYTASITMGGKTATVEFDIAPKPEAAPDDEGYTIHYAEETITAAEDYSLSTADDEGAEAVNSLRVTPGTTVYVRKNASDSNHVPSTWVPVDIPARPAAPAAQGVSETMAGKEDGKITGVDDTMEYSADGSTWTPCTGTEITDLACGTYYVRVKGTASSFVGTQAEVVINAGDQLTVTFNSNEGSAVASANVNCGAKVTKPADPTREHYTFSGWYTSTGDEGVEFNFDSVVTTNITLYAKWTEIVYNGTVSEEAGTVDGVTAEGLGAVADDRNANVELVVKAEATTPGDTEQTAIKGSAGSRTLDFLDITLKEVGGENIEETGSVLTIVIPFEKGNKQNIAVYRCHGAQAEALEENPAAGEEGFVVGADSITIYTKKFSTYAIGYTVPSSASSDDSYTPTYAIEVEKNENGEVKTNRSYASGGSMVTLTVIPDTGYALETLRVTDKNGKEVELTNKGDGKYTFKMPASKVTVKAVFAVENPFEDVSSDAYYYDAVLWAVKEGITNGISATTFSPNAPCTRAQMVTFLWRAAGYPEPTATACPFTDVDMDSYYGKAVLWAVENGITKGTSNTTFSPDMECSRAQMATFLCRMAGGKAESDTTAFTDVKAYAYYAESVQWAVENGITKGTGDNKFSPDATCTRAQMVTFLYRYYVK